MKVTIATTLFIGLTSAVLLLGGCSGKSSTTMQATPTTKPAAGVAQPAGYNGDQPTGYKEVQRDGFTFQWKVDGANLDVIVSYATTGWLGVGFGTRATMEGSNIIIGYVRDGKTLIEDDYGDAPNHHSPDVALAGRDDIMNPQGTLRNGVTELRFTIPLDSGDSHDVVLKPGTSYEVIMAHGPNSAKNTRAYHGGGRTAIHITL